MIVLAALFLFLVFKLTRRVALVLQRHIGASRTTQPSASATSGALDAPDERAELWTALDDMQLSRLLKDAAPHQDNSPQ